MNKALSIIRWKFVIPVSLVVAGILVFFIIFFDPLLSRALESGASKLNGAKVDVAGLRTKIFRGRLDIAKVQVTDQHDYMKNVVEAGPMAFQINFRQLFGKRIIIPEATLDGVKFNTARSTSGQLPRRVVKRSADEKPSAAQKLVQKYQDRFQFTLAGMEDQAKAKIEFNPKDLELVKRSEELKAQADAMPEAWKAKGDGLRVDERLKALDVKINEIKNTPTSGPEALTAIPESLKKLQEVKAELDAIKNDVKTAQTSLTQDLKGVQSGISSLKESKKKDLDNILSRFNLDFANPRKIVDGILGPVLLDRIKTSAHYLQVVRKHTSSEKVEAAFPPKPRAVGMDIPFPKPAALPRFWLAKAGLSGEYENIKAAGLLTDLTTNPARIGKPTRLNMEGALDQKKFLLKGFVDHVTAEKKAGVEMTASHIPLTEILTSGFLSNAVSGGEGTIQLDINVKGEDGLSGQLGLHLTKVRLVLDQLLEKVGIPKGSALSKTDELKSKFVAGIAKGIESMPSIDAKATIQGTLDDPDFTFDSNLLSQMDQVVKSTIGGLVEEQKKELEAKLDAIMAGKQKELNARVAELQQKLNAMLGGFDAKIQGKLNEVAGISLPSAGQKALPKMKFPSVDKLFK